MRLLPSGTGRGGGILPNYLYRYKKKLSLVGISQTKSFFSFFVFLLHDIQLGLCVRVCTGGGVDDVVVIYAEPHFTDLQALLPHNYIQNVLRKIYI